jgi:predicted nucleic acid-binding protein
MPYLIDTDVLIDVSRNTQGAIDFVDQLDDLWLISTITAMELMVGARNQREVFEIDRLVTTYTVVPLTDEIGETAYGLVKRFAKSHGLRVFDSLIAATALAEDLVLVTKNQKHFQMITELALKVPSY